MERELRDLQITNRAKDMFIERLQTERKDFLDQVVGYSRKVGQLETRLAQLLPSGKGSGVDSPASPPDVAGIAPVISEPRTDASV